MMRKVHGALDPIRLFCFVIAALLLCGAGLQTPAVALGQPIPASADDADSEVTLIAVADATVRSWQPNTNFGTEHYLELSREQMSDDSVREGAILLRFDLSSLPDGAVIDAAALELYMGQANGPDPIVASINFVTSAWNEATVTWNTFLTTEPLGLVASIGSATDAYWSWPITIYVQSWLDAPAANHGILLRGPTTGPDYDRWFESQDHNERVPRLRVRYHVPPYEFSGTVYLGEPDDRSTPLAGAVVELWGDDDEFPDGGVEGVRLDASGPTGPDGTFLLTWTPSAPWDYLHLIETDPPDVESAGAAAAPPGIVQGPNVVTYRYVELLETGERSFDEIAFWDRRHTELPDLIVSDLYRDDTRLCYRIENIGAGIAPPNHVAALFVDDIEQASTSIPFEMELGGQWAACFEEYVWRCTDEADRVAVVADHTNLVDESNEANNTLVQEWACDRTPPHFISGPTVVEITPSTAVIAWETDGVASGVLRYGTVPGQIDGERATVTPAQAHELLLAGLAPSTTYHYAVEATDAAGNRVQSDGHLFETAPAPDGQGPTIQIRDPGEITGTHMIRADADDNVDVDRVEFYLNGELVFTDFTPPYEWPFDSEKEENGEYALTARAFDLSGRSAEDWRRITTLNFIDLEQPQVRIFHPNQGDTVYGATPIWVNAADDSGWSQVDWYIDGKKMGGGSFPISNNLNIKFTWDTTFWSSAQHTIGVQATDGDGKIGVDTVTVNVGNAGPPAQPKLVVTAHQAYRHAHTLAVELTVENQGTATAQSVVIRDGMIGFQPLARTFNGATYLAEFATANRRATCVIQDGMSLAPGDKRVYVCPVVPILLHPNPPLPAIGNTIQLQYRDGLGAQYTESVNFVIGKTTNSPGAAASEAIAVAHASALTRANYLLVTSPNRLFNVNPFQTAAVNQVLADMAELAFEEDGALGYIASPTRTTLRNLIRSGGDWSNRLHSDLRAAAKGYLLLVGEREIIPVWRENRWTINWSNWTCTTREADLSDLPYADTGGGDASPELIVGRIIGNTPADLSTALRASLDGSFDRSHALLVSGLDGNSTIQKEFTDSVDEVEKEIKSDFSVTKLHWNTLAANQRVAQFRSNTSGKDVIVYQGHGSPDGWGPLDSTDFAGDPTASPPVPAISFGSTNPVVLGMACLTGSYEDHVANGPCGVFDGGDDNIAEAFFDQGAAVYIGATEVSAINQNRAAIKDFFASWWKSNVSVGKAFTDLKRARWSTTNDAAEMWAYEYNLYGDPKYGAVPASQASEQQPDVALEADAMPASVADVTIPDYEVTMIGDYHDVDIPGGDLLLEPGAYRIPTYAVRYAYPPGHQVQAVVMTERSDMVAESGLRLRINENMLATQDGGAATRIEGDDGWTPQEPFAWATTHDPDGTVILEIRIHPFFYDPSAGAARFYRQYRFEIEHTLSPVTIVATGTERDDYEPGDVIAFSAYFENSGEPQDVTVSAEIKQYPSGRRVEGLPLQTYHDMRGRASFARHWESDGAAPGAFAIEITLRNGAGQILDRRSQIVQLGEAAGTITAFDVTPLRFDPGQRVSAALTFVNQGSVDLSGEAWMRVVDGAGQVLKSYRQPFDSLRPTEMVTMDEGWDTAGAGRGEYAVVAYVTYNGGATDPVRALLYSGPLVESYLPIVAR